MSNRAKHAKLERCLSTPAQAREFLFKGKATSLVIVINQFPDSVLVVGELGAGKTSFIKRYVHQFFSSHYRATIGVDFALKVLHWDSDNLIRVQLWDVAGQERFGHMVRSRLSELS